MSVKVASLVLKFGPEDHTDFVVLLSLAGHANDVGDECWPSVKTIASEMRIGERSVIRSLKDLEADGWISVMRKSREHKGNSYRIALERLKSNASNPESHAMLVPDFEKSNATVASDFLESHATVASGQEKVTCQPVPSQVPNPTKSGANQYRVRCQTCNPSNMNRPEPSINRPEPSEKRLTAAPLSADADDPEPEPEPEIFDNESKNDSLSSAGADKRPSFSKAQLPKIEQQLLEYAELWNANCDSLEKVRINPLKMRRSGRFRKRCAKLGKRIKNGLTPEKFLEVVRKATESPFCRGEYTDWEASFDFLISEAGLTKTLEGNYDPASKRPKPVRIAMEESFR